MLLRVTCHWTIIAIATVITFVSFDVCVCLTTHDLQTNSNEYNENTVLTNAAADPIHKNELSNIRDKRKWSKFASWGKRNWTNNKWTNNKQAWGENRWMNFPTRRQSDIEKDDDANVAQFTSEKRKWYPFVSWGKRDSESQERHEGSHEDTSELAGDLRVTERAWSKLPTWGTREVDEEEPVKRRWSQLSAWGKRDEGPNDVESEEKDTLESGGNPDHKRNWSKFSSWGKRGDSNSDDLSGLGADKRTWSKFPTWGKRNEDENLEKRKWSQLATWGKRDLDAHAMDAHATDEHAIDAHAMDAHAIDAHAMDAHEIDAHAMVKKAWSKFASWGKRYVDLNPLSKRRWSPLAAWGKRSEDNSTSSDSVNGGRNLVNLFDINVDGALDNHELQTFTETLMTTKQKPDDDDMLQNKQGLLSSAGEVLR